jgi:hypothetical protein
MGKPTDQELETALTEAKRLRESGEDSRFLGKALLNCHYQHSCLLDVLHAAERYFHSGMAEQEHSRLLRAIDKAREMDDRDSRRERETIGL